MSRRRGVLVSLALIVALAGCSPQVSPSPSMVSPTPSPSAPPDGGFEPGPQTPTSLDTAVLRHTQFATDIDADGVPVAEGDAFPVGTQQILTLVAWDSAPAGTEIRIRLFQDDRLVIEHTHVVRRKELGGVVVPLVAPAGFPAGAFTAEVSWNGVPDEIANFTVGDVPREGVLIGSGEGRGPLAYAPSNEVLVVTRFAALRSKLGEATDSVLEAARRVGDLHDLEADGVTRATPEAAATEVQRLLSSAAYRYLLILGNDDVMPYFRVPNPVASLEEEELAPWELPADWFPSDDPYTDMDRDRFGVPDIATARIPSSEDAALLLTQLGDGAPPDGRAYALINQERRSQAASVISTISRSTGVQLDYSPPTDATRFENGPGPDARYLYVILHGIGTLTDSWTADLERWSPENPAAPFTGEWAVKARKDSMLDGITIANNSGSRGVVNVGACYGAWTLDTVQEPVHKTADNNLALHYLKSGTRAFVADTHLSYSLPNLADGLPLGRPGFERVFWRAVGEGRTLIDAFQVAKVETAAAIDELVAAGHVQYARINEKTVHHMVFLGRP